MSRPRVASLIASSTEIVCALGFEELLVARSHECDFPESVKKLPQITEPKLRTDVSSLEIDRQVRSLVRAGLSVYRVDAEQLRHVAPDVIITQDHCEVCAVSTTQLEAAVCDWLGQNVRIVSLKPNSLADVFNDIACVADALGDPACGERLVADMRARLSEIHERALSTPKRPRVAFVEWIDPLMMGGNWMPQLIGLVGAFDVFGRAGEHSGRIAFDVLRAADADVIVVAPCGFDLERTLLEMTPLIEHPGWPELRAVRNGRVYVADGNAYFNRPGPRLVESVEILAETIRPEQFDFGHESIAWLRLA